MDQYVCLPNGIDARHPFFDLRLVEIGLRIPMHAKVRGGLTKVVVRDALRGILPDEIAIRGGHTQYDFLVTTGLKAVWPRISSLLASSLAEEMGYINAARLRQELDLIRQGGSTPNANAALAALALELWLRQLNRSVLEAADYEGAVGGGTPAAERQPAWG